MCSDSAHPTATTTIKVRPSVAVEATMHLSEFWNIFLKIVQYTSAFMSVSLNCILIFLILAHSPKKLGMYKYLMIYISSFEALYSLWDVTTEPVSS